MKGRGRTIPLVLAFLLAGGCAPAGPAAGPAEEEPAGPTLAVGSLSRQGEAEARELLDTAREALAADRVAEAEEAATRVVEGYPSSRVSVEALWLRARLRAAEATRLLEEGDTLTAGVDPVEEVEPPAESRVEARLREARADLQRLLSVLPVGDPREAQARLALARVQLGQGAVVQGLRTVLTLPTGAEVPGEEVQRWVRDAANRLSAPELASLLEAADPGQPLRLPVLVAYARALRIAGDEDGARRFAGSALDAGATGLDAEIARALLEGRGLPRGTDAPVPVGVVLPLGGSPAFQVFARQLQEGIQAAVHAWGLEGEVELITLDDGGDVPTAANLVRAAETRGAVAVLGLLEDGSLAAATDVRVDVPLVSPTAYQVPTGVDRVLSLNAFDPGAGEALARWAAESGIRQVAVIHSSSGASLDEAQVFTETFQSLGGSVLRSFPYAEGTTFWEAQILGAAELRPEALVLPVPPEDVPGIAPQVTFFGLDTLGIRILGTGGWTDPQILGEVDPRHTDGVVAAAPVRPGPRSEGYLRFREAYEARFQRSLVDDAIPALGYDAASLVFQGIWSGAGETEEVAAALTQVRALQGATGILSVVDGALRREHHVVCVERGVPTPIQGGQLPAQRYRPYPPDEETGEVPEGPGRPDGFICPLPLDSLAPGDTLLPGDTVLPVDTFRIVPAPGRQPTH